MGEVLRLPRGHRRANITVRDDAEIIALPVGLGRHVRLKYDFAWDWYAAQLVDGAGNVIQLRYGGDYAKAAAIADEWANEFGVPVFDITAKGRAA